MNHLDISEMYLVNIDFDQPSNKLITTDAEGNKQEYDVQGITSLNCSSNGLSSLSELPFLEALSCFDNFLTVLHSLPKELKYFNCVLNRLTALPALPENLKSLDCATNQMTSLPTLPVDLINLYCSGNQIVKLPTLPEEIKRLDCSNNPLKYIQYLKNRPSYYLVPSHLREKHADGAYQRNYVLQMLSRYLVYFFIRQSKYYNTFRVFGIILSETLV